MGSSEGANVQVTRDVEFARRESGPLVLDLYRPETGAGATPVVVWLHGGGWFTGDRTLAPDLAERAAASGCAFASIEYRLSGEAIFPAQLHDVRAAVRFLRREAGRFGLDPDAIGLWGASAGGHLAVLAGVTGGVAALPGEFDGAPDGTSVDVRAVAASYPPVDLAAVVADSSAARPGADPATFPESRLLGGPPAQRPELAAASNPLEFVSPAAPPMQLSHGTGDVLVDHGQSEGLFAALTAAGVEAELFLLDGYRHGFLNPPGRLDVEIAKVMDDGRLVTEGRARAQRRTSGDPHPAETTFGFADVDDFFRTHLGEPA